MDSAHNLNRVNERTHRLISLETLKLELKSFSFLPCEKILLQKEVAENY